MAPRAPSGAILAPPRWRMMGAAAWTRGGLEQDFHRYWVNLGPVYISFLVSRSLELYFVGVCFQSFFHCSLSPFGLECIAKINFSQKSPFMDFGVDLCCLWEASGTVVLVCCALKAGLKINRFLVWTRIPISGSAEGDLSPIWALLTAYQQMPDS